MTSNDIHDEEDFSKEEAKIEAFLKGIDNVDFDTNRIRRLTFEKISRDRAARRRRWGYAACAAAACLAIILTLPRVLSIGDSDPAGMQELALNDTQEYVTCDVPVGQRKEITLCDGTRLVANSRTRVIYPKQFCGDTRKIFVSGEAYLEVAHDSARPFVVEADQFSLRVLGTKFNLNTYDAMSTSVVLAEGSVEVTTESGEVMKMRPNQELTIKFGTFESLSRVNADDYTCWITGAISVEGETMEEVVRRLNFYYGADLQCAPEIAGKRIYGKLAMPDSLSAVLKVLNEVIPFRIENENYLTSRTN